MMLEVSMKANPIKQVVTVLFGIVQVFWIGWFFLRAAIAYLMIALDWQGSGMTLYELGFWSFEFFWVGVLPFVIICLSKGLVLRLVDKKAFTNEGYKLSLSIFILTGLVVLSSLLQDFFYYKKPHQDWLTVVDQYMLPYIGAYLILLLLLILVFVIKNGKSVQEDMDGIV